MSSEKINSDIPSSSKQIELDTALEKAESDTSFEVSELKESFKSLSLSPEAEAKLRSSVKNPDQAIQSINALLSSIPHDQIRSWEIRKLKNRKGVKGYFGTTDLYGEIKGKIEESILGTRSHIHHIQGHRNVDGSGDWKENLLFFPYMENFPVETNEGFSLYISQIEKKLNTRLDCHLHRKEMEELILSHRDELLDRTFMNDYLNKHWKEINKKTGVILGVFSENEDVSEEKLEKFGQMIQSILSENLNIMSGRMSYHTLMALETFLSNSSTPNEIYENNYENNKEGENEKILYRRVGSYAIPSETEKTPLPEIKIATEKKEPTFLGKLRNLFSKKKKEAIPENILPLNKEKFLNSKEGALFKLYILSSPNPKEIINVINTSLENNLENLSLTDEYWNSNKIQKPSNWGNIDKKKAFKEISNLRNKSANNDDFIENIRNSGTNSDMRTVFEVLAHSQQLESQILSYFKSGTDMESVFSDFKKSNFSKKKELPL